MLTETANEKLKKMNNKTAKNIKKKTVQLNSLMLNADVRNA